MNEITLFPWMGLLTMAFLLGVRHGLDWDHLASIDAMSRSFQKQPELCRRSGLFFSLGHGSVVMLLSILITAGLFERWVPEWLDGFGHWISVGFLLFFGLLTLSSLVQPQRPASPRAGLMRLLLRPSSGAFGIMLIGALFALSFDTFSQVALFAMSAKARQGQYMTAVLAALFTLGMIAADGLNGWLIAGFIQKARLRSEWLFRLLTVSIALFSFAIAFVELG